MLTTQKETPAGCNHPAGANTQNVDILLVLAALGRIASALERSFELAKDQNEYLGRIVEGLEDRMPF